MKSRVTNLLLAGIFTLSLTACGAEPTSTFQVVGYEQAPNTQAQAVQSEPVAAPVKKATTTKKTTTASTAKKTTTTAKTTATKTETKEEKATTTATTTNSNLSVAQKLLTKSKQTYDALNSFSATFTMFSKRNDRTVPNGRPILTAETKYIFQAPRNASFNVVKHSLNMVVGAKMVWKGGNTAKVKAGGVLGLFPLDLSLDDDKMTTNRKWRFDQLDHIGILSRALSPKATVTLAGKSTINGKEAYMIKVKGTGLDEEVTEENIALDAKTFLIIADEMYSGQDLVFQTKIDVDGTNVQVPASAFEV